MGCGSSVIEDDQNDVAAERYAARHSFRTQSSMAMASDEGEVEWDPLDIDSVHSEEEEENSKQNRRQSRLSTGSTNEKLPARAASLRSPTTTPPRSVASPLLFSPTTHDGTLLIPHSAAGGQFRAVDSTAIMTPTMMEASGSCPTLNASLSRTFTLPHVLDSPVVSFRPGVSAIMQNEGDTPKTTPPALPPVLPPDFNEYQLPSPASDDCHSVRSAGHECEEPGPLKSAVSSVVATLKARINAPAGVTSSNDHLMLKSWDDADGGLTEVISSQRKCCERKTVHSVVLWSGELIPPVAKKTQSEP